MVLKATAPPGMPKYVKLAEEIRSQLRRGDLQAGDRLPSYAEMRQHYGASRPTVDKVLDLLQAEGIITREPGRGVYISSSRIRYGNGVIGFVGMAGANQRHPYSSQLLEGVHDVFDREGIEILLLSRNSAMDWSKVDGVLSCEMEPDEFLSRLPAEMPRVSLLMASAGSSSVITDDEGGAFEATRYLISLGHKRIGYLSSSTSHRISASRLNGYHCALREAGIEPKECWVRELQYRQGWPGGYLERGLGEMKFWLQEGWVRSGCTALLTANDDTAIGAIQAMREAGMSVPDDVSLIGFDGTEVSQYFSPRLTTVEIPLRGISAQGAEMLLRQMAQRREGLAPKVQDIVLAPRLIVRESTQPPRKRN